MDIAKILKDLLLGISVPYQLTIGLLPDELEIALWVIGGLITIFFGGKGIARYFQERID